MIKYNEDELREELVIPIYTQDLATLEKNNGDECHYKTEEKAFKFSELLAIATKGSYALNDSNKKLDIKRGGALVFVEDRKEPYLSRDDYSVNKIIEILEKNPLVCLSGLNIVGSSNIYVKNCNYIVKDNLLYLPNDARLFLSAKAKEKVIWVYEVLTFGLKKSCPYEKRNKIREKIAKKRT